MTNDVFLSHVCLNVEFIEKHGGLLELLEKTTTELAREGKIEDIEKIMNCFRIFLQGSVGVIKALSQAQQEIKTATIN